MNELRQIERDEASVQAGDDLPTARSDFAESEAQASRPRRWPLLVIGFGLVLTALWGALLGWAVIEAVETLLF
jgi:hypothetical protein